MTEPGPQAAELRALTWRCRRGMRELDQLLVGYLHDHYADAEPRLQSAFVALLEQQDPVIFGYLVRGVVPEDADTRDIVGAVLGAADAGRIRT